MHPRRRQVRYGCPEPSSEEGVDRLVVSLHLGWAGAPERLSEDASQEGLAGSEWVERELHESRSVEDVPIFRGRVALRNGYHRVEQSQIPDLHDRPLSITTHTRIAGAHEPEHASRARTPLGPDASRPLLAHHLALRVASVGISEADGVPLRLDPSAEPVGRFEKGDPGWAGEGKGEVIGRCETCETAAEDGDVSLWGHRAGLV